MSFRAEMEQSLDRLSAVDADGKARGVSGLIALIRKKRAEMMQARYRSLSTYPRYRDAIEFLIDDLCASSELTDRMYELRRAGPTMLRVLPEAMMQTVVKAIDFAILSLQIDVEMATQADAGMTDSISDSEYRRLLRVSARPQQLQRQLELLLAVGFEIEAVVHKPFVATALKLSRRPARLMGLEALQGFLERGFDAFKAMRGSEEFLRILSDTETGFITSLNAE